MTHTILWLSGFLSWLGLCLLLWEIVDRASERKTPRPKSRPPSTHPEKLAGSEDLVEYWTPTPRPAITAAFEATPSMRLRSQSIGRGNRCIRQEDGQPLMWVGTEAPEDPPPTQPIRFRGLMKDL